MNTIKPDKYPLEIIQIDATILDIYVVDRSQGESRVKRPQLVTATGKDGLVGGGETVQSAIDSCLEAQKKHPQGPESQD